MNLLAGKIALVTGATRGIGQAIAIKLAEQGATVMGTATSAAGADSITQQLKQFNGQGIILNLEDPAAPERLFSTLEAQQHIPAILVNNAGITADNLLLRMKDEEWQRVIEVNLTSSFRLMRLAVKHMMKNRWGRIINITSVVGVTGNPGQGNYVAAKAGLIGLSKSLAYEVASRGITVNCVAPGFTDTDMTRKLTDDQKQAINAKIAMGRMGTAEDIAAAVEFLTSAGASYITGETIHVNGGMYMP